MAEAETAAGGVGTGRVRTRVVRSPRTTEGEVTAPRPLRSMAAEKASVFAASYLVRGRG